MSADANGGRPIVIHCSYHKCLTVYYKRVMQALFHRRMPWRGGFRHYNSDLEGFYEDFANHRVASINNRALDLERLGGRLGRVSGGRFRVSRFIRDPRDLVVSGYFYHRRGAEPWTRIAAPTASDWSFANGHVPRAVRDAGTSFAAYLRSVDEEAGLLAELSFRRHHFDSMRAWPEGHPDIVTHRYEQIVGREVEVFRALFRFYGLSFVQRIVGGWLAKRYSFKKIASDPHVRDPASGQWRNHFTPRVRSAFEARHPGLIEHLGYEAE